MRWVNSLRRVQAGVIEVPHRDDLTLYRGQHTREEALRFLTANGFHPWRIEVGEIEDDVYFRRL